jgi:predicted alpha/beta hydrolase
MPMELESRKSHAMSGAHPCLGSNKAIEVRDLVHTTTAGSQLSLTLYLPEKAPRAVVVLHGGIGIPKRFYRHFATWLAEHRNLACLTYDYRDFGESSWSHVRASLATLTDWGIHDQVAALDVAQMVLPRVPLWVIGHSFGGLMLPFHPPREIDRAIIVASGLVRMDDHPLRFQAFARQLWQVSGPLATTLFGYLPGRFLGLGTNWPAGVFWQLRRWCLSKSFYLSDAGTQIPPLQSGALTAPTLLIAIADDPMMPPKAVWRIMELLPDSIKRQKVFRPAEFGLTSIGHLGAFSIGNAAVWPAIVD